MKKRTLYLLILPFILMILLYELAPLLVIIFDSFKDPTNQTFTLEHYEKAFSSKFYLLSIKNSLIITVISTIVGLFGGLIAAYCIFTSEGRLKKFFINIINMSSNFQGIQLAFAFMIMLGNAGTFILLAQQSPLGLFKNFDLYSEWGILLTFIYFQIPLATILLYPAFDRVRQQYIEAAQLMNCTGVKFWLQIGLPLILPNIFATVSVLFANAFAAYATPFALVGNNFALLPIRISTLFQGEAMPRPEFGSALSVIMLAFIALATLICSWASKVTSKGELYE